MICLAISANLSPAKNEGILEASARFCSLLFGLFGAGCFVAKALEALPLRETGIIGMVFVVTALPLSLLGAALREPVSARPEPR
jgi:hypothetical protein